MPDAAPDHAPPATFEIEEELFGGPLQYSHSRVTHQNPLLSHGFIGMAKELPRMGAEIGRVAWRVDRRALVAVLGAEVGQGVGSALVLTATNRMLTSLFAGGPTTERLADAAPTVLLLAAVTAVIALLSAVSVAMSGRLEPQVDRAVAEEYYTALSRVELAATEREEIASRLEAGRFGADSASRMLSLSIAILNAVITLLAAALVLATLQPVLLPLLLLIAVPKGVAAVRNARREYLSRRQWIQNERALNGLGFTFCRPAAAAEIRAHQAGALLLRGFRALSHLRVREHRRLSRARGITFTVAAALSGSAAVVTYGCLWWLLTIGAMPLSVGGTAVLAIRNATSRLGSVIQQVNHLYEEATRLTDTKEAIALAQQHAMPAEGQPLPQPVEAIRTEQVSYTYPGAATPSLQQVSVEIPRGRVTALVGENGSGKSTLAKVLAGLMLPTDGYVWWEGADDRVEVREAAREDVFTHIALLVQDFPRWELSLASNVAIGDGAHPRDQERMEHIAHDAGVSSFMADMPRGWNSMASKGYVGGTNLSGGQWQRVADARMRYRGAPFVLVDEPTSALDPDAEIEAFDRLYELAAQGHAVVLITHRLAATARADAIYVLHDGRVEEHGTHSELMARLEGLYRRMYLAQAQQYARHTPTGHFPGPRAAADDEDLPR